VDEFRALQVAQRRLQEARATSEAGLSPRLLELPMAGALPLAGRNPVARGRRPRSAPARPERHSAWCRLRLLLAESQSGADGHLGVYGVPTITIDDELFWGDDRLDDAAADLLRTSEPSRNAQDDPISTA
jgi:hypothetical protein